jgi:AcrR family transcriptional regulator
MQVAILHAARVQLAEVGPAALSLRAVARELGVVSSAVYRYVPSRDALLTLLIIDAYNDLGAAAETAESKIARVDLLGRFVTICTAVRAWALAHPHEYALIFGSPVPGYEAPQDTIGPASRIPLLLTEILRARESAFVAADPAEVRLAKVAIAPLREGMGSAVPDVLMTRGLTAWLSLFGAVSMELFGHLHNVVADAPSLRKRFFEQEMRNLATGLQLLD